LVSALCPSITYTFTDTGTTTTPVPIFSNLANSMSVNTASVLKVGTYNLKLEGDIIGSYKTYATNFILITVNVYDSCATSTIVP
jgi:hypothetical protein